MLNDPEFPFEKSLDDDGSMSWASIDSFANRTNARLEGSGITNLWWDESSNVPNLVLIGSLGMILSRPSL